MAESHQVKGECLRERRAVRCESSTCTRVRDECECAHSRTQVVLANNSLSRSATSRSARCLQKFASLRSSQSSLEYLLVVAITFVIILPATYLFYSYSKESSYEITDAQITKIGRTIVDSAESIFYSGQGSKTVLELNIPDNVDSAQIVDGREIVFNVTTNFGISEIVFFSSVNLTTTSSNCNANICNIPGLASSGLKKVKIERSE